MNPPILDPLWAHISGYTKNWILWLFLGQIARPKGFIYYVTLNIPPPLGPPKSAKIEGGGNNRLFFCLNLGPRQFRTRERGIFPRWVNFWQGAPRKPTADAPTADAPTHPPILPHSPQILGYPMGVPSQKKI